MTILASTSVKQTYVNRGLLQGFAANCGITLYSGAKPTAADYIANFNANYNSSRAVYLWHSNTGTVWSVTNNTTLYLSSPPSAVVPTRNGTATWAVIWTTAVTSGNMSGTSIPNSAFIVVDVSTTADGTGVIQLTSTTLATTDPAVTIDTAGFTVI